MVSTLSGVSGKEEKLKENYGIVQGAEVSDGGVLPVGRFTPREILLQEVRRQIDKNSKEQKLSYEFTDDPWMIQQYYKIREKCYREDLSLPDFNGGEDFYDKPSYIAVVRKGDRVIGGARIIISAPEGRVPLSLEEKGFMMADLFPELKLEDKSYCEFSRLAILPEHRGMDSLQELLRSLSYKAINVGCGAIFAITSIPQARCYRRMFRLLGLDFETRSDIKVPFKPLYGDMKIVLSVSRLLSE